MFMLKNYTHFVVQHALKNGECTEQR